MTFLLTFLALINFLDKIVLGMVAVPLMAEMHLSPSEFGLIAGSFFWLFSTSTIAVGFMSNRFQTRWLLLTMGISWALVQLPQALTSSAAALLACRVILGAAEGPAFPVTVHALYKWFPDQKRNVPIAIVNQGAAAGLLLAGLLIPLVTHRWGWRMNFAILGAVGAIWSVLWLFVGREGNLGAHGAKSSVASGSGADHAAHSTHFTYRLPYRRILSDPSVLSVFLLGFAAYWMLGQNLMWLPAYLEKGLGFPSIDAGRWFALVIATTAPVNIGLSWLSQRMMERGASTRLARVQLVCLTMLAGASGYVALLVLDLAPVQKVMLFAVSCALPTLSFSLAPALLAEMVPESQRGSIVSIHTALASLGAAVAPAVMGRIVQLHGGDHAYEPGFATASIVLIVAALAALRWLHPERSYRTLNRSAAPLTA
ncbi:MFS transporter [Caballeronia choica]|jgi:sugar phosphate permease|uniref:MFS transporter n=2 Tax=Caballeronia choica TaxID=326476 RepID=A0A158KY55_9BURK|nr:MFS transporter [Caballeronia choica]